MQIGPECTVEAFRKSAKDIHIWQAVGLSDRKGQRDGYAHAGCIMKF